MATPAEAKRAAAAPAASLVSHGELLPDALAQHIPASDARILCFLLAFLQKEGLEAPMFVNGGYVRDLLLGKEPDDLDLSLCLRDCPEDVTVMNLLEKLPTFASKTGEEFGISEVKIATILSNEAKDKKVDTFKAHFLDAEGRKTEVDVMPTIGDEVYEEGNRIPLRDQRGTPEQDALRRDLTIGALLLQVEHAGGEGSALRYRVFDFYDGAADILHGVLRSPYPKGQSVAETKALVLRSPAEESLATSLGIDKRPEPEALQVLWWAKILQDDPVRACRTLRFAAKLRFVIHDAFWEALPFALPALRSKVAGGRKGTEYHKIGTYGLRPSAQFFELAFTRTLPDSSNMAVALLGGQDEKGCERTMSEVVGFDLDAFRGLAASMAGTTDPNEILGGLLAAAVFSARFADATASAASPSGAGGDIARAEAEYGRACDGLCVSNALREAGIGPLWAAAKWLVPPPPSSLDRSFSVACGGIAPEILRLNTMVWEDLLLPGSATRPPWSMQRRLLTLGLVRCVNTARATEVERCLEVVSRPRPPVRGNVLSTKGVLEVPPLIRRVVMSLLEVGLRLQGCEEPLEDGEQLQRLLNEVWPGLREALASSVWFEADGKTLKPEFAPPKKGSQKAK